MKRQGLWFVRHQGRILCTDGKWRNNTGSILNIKFWKELGWVERSMGKKGILEWHAFCVYPEDAIDCCGRISRSSV